ncbi:MAG: hypothetical protein EBY21_00210 [Alphaproteobacteria bacterium]|nr:hypothetical protein [Alphaproteobacteria bacterium]
MRYLFSLGLARKFKPPFGYYLGADSHTKDENIGKGEKLTRFCSRIRPVKTGLKKEIITDEDQFSYW